MHSNKMLFGSQQNLIYVLDLNDGTMGTIDLIEHPITSLQVHGHHIYVGCQNGALYVLDDNYGPIEITQPHQNNINSIYVDQDRLLTGSWDQSAKSFTISSGDSFELQPLATVDGFKHAVAVQLRKMNDKNYYICGSQDGKIKIYEECLSEPKKYKVTSEFTLHGHLIRQISNYKDFIVTCSNDCTIKFTGIDDYRSEAIKDTTFIYAFTIFTSNNVDYIVFTNENRMLTVYDISDITQMKQVQTVELPSAGWCLYYYSQNLYVGLDSGNITVLSISSTSPDLPEVLENAENIKLFNEDVINTTATEKGQSMDSSEIEQLTDISLKDSLVGKKEGEVKVFNDKGKPTAYMWKNGAWDYVGEVVGKDQSNVTHYEGDGVFDEGDYDKVFLIDYGDGVERRLPFNYNDSATDAADKFCVRENINKDNLTQIRDWILQQTQGITQEMRQESENRSKSSSAVLEDKSKFPWVQYFRFKELPYEKLVTKLKSLNAENKLDRFIQLLETVYKTEQLDGVHAEVMEILQIIIKPPITTLFPFYDVLRYLCNKLTNKESIEWIVDKVNSLLKINASDVTCLMLLLKAVCNLLTTASKETLLLIVNSLSDFNRQFKIFTLDNKCKALYVQVCMNVFISSIHNNTREGYEYLTLIETGLDLDLDEKYIVNYVRLYGSMVVCGYGDNNLKEKVVAKASKVEKLL